MSEKFTYQVIVTGYGPFMSITRNPSHDLQELIAKNFAKHFGFQNKPFNLLYTCMIPVETDHVDRVINEIDTAIQAHKADHPEDKYLIIHIGKPLC
jgi:pyrrolidone-carboxylate peptidase